ncbi:MAG: lipopolysaccharide kinase InaA family protein [Phycisphaerae bacterium]
MTTKLEIEAPFREALRAAGLDRFDAMMTVAGGPPTSRHRYRETLPLEVSVDGRPRAFFLKRVFKVPPRHAIAPLFRFHRGFSQPSLEWHMLAALRDAGIPAMRRVAFGEERVAGRPRAAFLLVEAVPWEATLEHWLVPGFPRPAVLSAARRRRLLYEIGRLIRRLHAAGFRWPDIQAKHIFADCTADAPTSGGWAFCLIDVERMTRLAPVDPHVPPDRAARKDLRRLAGSLSSLTPDRHDIRSFLVGYGSGNDRSVQRRWRAASAGDADLARRFREADVRPRLPDDYRHPRSLCLYRGEGMVAQESALPLLRQAGLDTLRSVFEYRGGESLHKRGLARFRERVRVCVADSGGAARTYYLKRYRRPPVRAQLRRMIEANPRRSGAWREGRFSEHLALLGVPAVRSVAFGEEMGGWWEVRSFTVTAAIEGPSLETLADRARADPSQLPTRDDRREIIRQLAWITRVLHANQLFHRDLYLSHVLLTRNADGRIVLHLIDLARMIQSPRRTFRWRVKDLASLDYSAPAGLVTRADRLRFLYHYLTNAAVTAPLHRRKARMRTLIGLIDMRMCRIARHDARRRERWADSEPPGDGRSGGGAQHS